MPEYTISGEIKPLTSVRQFKYQHSQCESIDPNKPHTLHEIAKEIELCEAEIEMMMGLEIDETLTIREEDYSITISRLPDRAVSGDDFIF